MGFLYDNNEISTDLGFGYYIFEPTSLIIKGDYNLHINHQMLYKPISYKELNVNGTAHIIWKNHYLLD